MIQWLMQLFRVGVQIQGWPNRIQHCKRFAIALTSTQHK